MIDLVALEADLIAKLEAEVAAAQVTAALLARVREALGDDVPVRARPWRVL